MAGFSNIILFKKKSISSCHCKITILFSDEAFQINNQQKIEARSEGPKFMLSLVKVVSREFVNKFVLSV
jgi:hypothetical protein